MSHQDIKARTGRQADDLQTALQWLLTGVLWSGIRFRRECSWTPQSLVCAALLWAWSDELTLGERFQTARRILLFLSPRQSPLAATYQSFVELLVRWTTRLSLPVQAALRTRMAAQSGVWTVAGRIAFGVDGSRVDLPRTASNENAYAASRPGERVRTRRRKKRGTTSRRADTPQMWLTTMWHVGSGLPWDWRTGAADSSERAHLLEMLPHLPEQALLLADAGFVGYDYLRAILDSERDLVIRVGANVRLLQQLGFVRESAGTVYLWPDAVARRQQHPIVLRLVVAHNGRHPVYLVTSLLDPQELSDGQVLELYARRWGVELFYRSFKQTFGRRKLRSQSAAMAAVELQWSLFGLWTMSLYALVHSGLIDDKPDRLSLAATLRAFRRLIRDHQHRQARGAGLDDRLRRARIDPYQRASKTSRNYPRQRQHRPPGAPRITSATPEQRRQAANVNTHARKPLTA